MPLDRPSIVEWRLESQRSLLYSRRRRWLHKESSRLRIWLALNVVVMTVTIVVLLLHG